MLVDCARMDPIQMIAIYAVDFISLRASFWSLALALSRISEARVAMSSTARRLVNIEIVSDTI